MQSAAALHERAHNLEGVVRDVHGKELAGVRTWWESRLAQVEASHELSTEGLSERLAVMGMDLQQACMRVRAAVS